MLLRNSFGIGVTVTALVLGAALRQCGAEQNYAFSRSNSTVSSTSEITGTLQDVELDIDPAEDQDSVTRACS